MTKSRFDTRLHLIAPASDAPQIEAALDKLSPRMVRFVPGAGLKSEFVAASGQWTSEEAAALLAALVAWPSVIVARGYADGAEDVGAVKVEPGDDASKIAPEEVRRSFERVLSERAAEVKAADVAEAEKGVSNVDK